MLKNTKRFHYLFLIVATFALIACQSLNMPQYDAKTDQLLTETQAMTDRLFIEIEHNIGLKKNRYAIYKEHYKDILARLHVIKTRASALPNNRSTVEQLTLLIDTIHKLHIRHKLGFSSVREIRGLQRLVDAQFEAVFRLELAKRREQEHHG